MSETASNSANELFRLGSAHGHNVKTRKIDMTDVGLVEELIKESDIVIRLAVYSQKRRNPDNTPACYRSLFM